MSNSCDPVDYSPPGSSVHGTFQARMLEQIAISCSRGLNSSLLDWQVGSLSLNHQGNPIGHDTRFQKHSICPDKKQLQIKAVFLISHFFKVSGGHLEYENFY